MSALATDLLTTTTTTFLFSNIERLDDCNQMYLQRMYMMNVNNSLELLDK